MVFSRGCSIEHGLQDKHADVLVIQNKIERIFSAVDALEKTLSAAQSYTTLSNVFQVLIVSILLRLWL